MSRALRRPVEAAFIAVIESINVGGGNSLATGDGKDPNHEVPYAIVSLIPGGDIDGPMSDPNADESLRIQVTGVGGTRDQASWTCDLVRIAMTRAAMDAELVSGGRQILTLDLDLSLNAHDERGLTESVFSAVDQYVVSTTPL